MTSILSKTHCKNIKFLSNHRANKIIPPKFNMIYCRGYPQKKIKIISHAITSPSFPFAIIIPQKCIKAVSYDNLLPFALSLDHKSTYCTYFLSITISATITYMFSYKIRRLRIKTHWIKSDSSMWGSSLIGIYDAINEFYVTKLLKAFFAWLFAFMCTKRIDFCLCASSLRRRR